jgi:carbonic anhydrase
LSDIQKTRVDDLVAYAQRQESVFTAGGLPAPPALAVAIVACMDSRIDMFRLFGLHLGEAHVIRNAGGIVTDDVMRSLTLSQALLDTREIMIIQHTGCGLIGEEDELRRRVADATGTEPPWELGAFTDVEASVHRQLEVLHDSPHLIGGKSARGFVYEVETGRLREVG